MPFFSKIYEKAMANLLVNFLDANCYYLTFNLASDTNVVPPTPLLY